MIWIGDYTFDVESFPNLFTCIIKSEEKGWTWVFEISDRQNDLHFFKEVLAQLAVNRCRMVGYNNLNYDYPLIHYVALSGNITANDIYKKSLMLLSNRNSFGNMPRRDEILVPQLDLFKIWHYDNKNRMTSLKLLEFNMRMEDIQECSVPFDTIVPEDRIDEVIRYNKHDVKATSMFYRITRGYNEKGEHNVNDDKIAFREELSEKYRVNMMNFNDTKIGKEFFIMKLQEADKQSCYEWVDNRRKPRQTLRETIPFKDMVLPYIQFEDEAFQDFLDRFKAITVTKTKDSLKGVSHTHNGFTFDFGTGGIHGSIPSGLVEIAEDETILDIDVKSYYPNLSIVNGFCPEHLGELFCSIYAELYKERDTVYTKKLYPTINLMLKLALNGVYGDSNSEYSPFFDSHMTMKITLNGQLLLCMLAEQIMKVGRMLQINTDGMTFVCKKEAVEHVKQLVQWWEKLTGLEMEYATYTRMLIKDVNNYLALTDSGKVKEKGAYETKRDWHKNHSKLVVPKAVKEWFVNGTDVEDFICNHSDTLDFCLRTAIKGEDKCFHDGERQQKVTRYYISNSGESLKKVMEPKDTPGSYKRKSKLTDCFYESVVAELREKYPVTDIRIEEEHTVIVRKREKVIPEKRFMMGPDGVEVEVDITGLPYDERIHNKKGTKHEDVRNQDLHQGHPVRICNTLSEEAFDDICYDWYIEEAKKLMKGISDEDEGGQDDQVYSD